MLVWCSLLFFLGVLAFLDSIMNMGEIFRKVNSVLFMLISMGLLLRTTTKIKSQKIESLENKLYNLEQEVRTLKDGEKKLSKF